MDLLAKSDEEIFAIAKPFWENLVKASNMKDYGGFTRDFSTQMLFGANEVELGKQWANNKIITNLKETYEPFGTLRRGEHITVLIKQTNKEIPGEFLGRLFYLDQGQVMREFRYQEPIDVSITAIGRDNQGELYFVGGGSNGVLRKMIQGEVDDVLCVPIKAANGNIATICL